MSSASIISLRAAKRFVADQSRSHADCNAASPLCGGGDGRSPEGVNFIIATQSKESSSKPKNEIFNRSDQTAKRQQLRNESPLAERLLWAHLKGAQMGVKFRRQVSVGRYVVDFYCPTLQLAIEVDGASHARDDAQEYDELRRVEIEALGVRFVRLANEDLYRDAPSVAAALAAVVASESEKL